MFRPHGHPTSPRPASARHESGMPKGKRKREAKKAERMENVQKRDFTFLKDRKRPVCRKSSCRETGREIWQPWGQATASPSGKPAGRQKSIVPFPSVRCPVHGSFMDTPAGNGQRFWRPPAKKHTAKTRLKRVSPPFGAACGKRPERTTVPPVSCRCRPVSVVTVPSPSQEKITNAAAYSPISSIRLNIRSVCDIFGLLATGPDATGLLRRGCAVTAGLATGTARLS